MSHGMHVAIIVGGSWFGFSLLDVLLFKERDKTRNHVFNAMLGLMGALMYIADRLP